LRCQPHSTRRFHRIVRTSLGVGGLVSALAAASCSSDASSSDTPDGAGGAAPDTGQGFVVGPSDLPGDSESASAADATGCLGETRQAEAIGLDMFVMLDLSGSMLDPLPAAPSVNPTISR